MIELLKRSILRSNILAVARRGMAPRLVILRYHSVMERPEACYETIGPAIIHAATDFKDQMAYVSRHCVPLSMDHVLDILDSSSAFPRNAVAITFDDGFVDNVLVAAPILGQFKIPATFYLTVGSIQTGDAPWFVRLRCALSSANASKWHDPTDGCTYDLNTPASREAVLMAACRCCAPLSGTYQRQFVEQFIETVASQRTCNTERLMMTWQQASELRKAGHIIGSHTVTHPNLAQIDPTTVRVELADSKIQLERHMGSPVIHFSYPSPFLQPHWNENTLAICRDVQYRTAVTCDQGSVRRGDCPLRLRRSYVPSTYREFRWYLENSFLGRSL